MIWNDDKREKGKDLLNELTCCQSHLLLQTLIVFDDGLGKKVIHIMVHKIW